MNNFSLQIFPLNAFDYLIIFLLLIIFFLFFILFKKTN